MDSALIKFPDQRYVRPLKRPEVCSLIESGLVDEMFFQVPELIVLHEHFLSNLQARLEQWHGSQQIGDVILNNFTRQSVVDTYTAFINNWKNAKHALRVAIETKPAFSKYLERCAREHKNKLSLDSLMIMPVQRIPRYEIFIKEILKHTSVDHPDHASLVRAQKEIHALALQVNRVQGEAGLSQAMLQRLREIEAIIDGLDDLVSENRIFYRYDVVEIKASATHKDRCLFLFSDQLIITNIKAKHSALRKNPIPIPQNQPNFLENHRFKMLMKISLDDLEIAKNSLPMLQEVQGEVSHLQDDLRVMSKISELVQLLSVDHNSAEQTLEDLKLQVRGQIQDRRREMTTNPMLTSLELSVTTEQGVENFTVTFRSADERLGWEKCFTDAKEALTLQVHRKLPPTFLKTVPIERNRPGVLFCCGATTLGLNEWGYPNIWVCNSDGHELGQLCVIRLTPELDVSSCNGVTNSQILCSIPVPSCATPLRRKKAGGSGGSQSKELTTTPELGQSQAVIGDAANSPSSKISSSNLALESDSSGDEGTLLGSDTEPNPLAYLSTASIKRNKFGVGQSKSFSNDQEASEETIRDDVIVQVPTMWIGTEDGSIHVYNYNDNIRMRKCKALVHHPAPVNFLLFCDGKVFAALGNLTIAVYNRYTDGEWNFTDPMILSLESMGWTSPVTCMASVTSRVWCGIQNAILILHPQSLKFENAFAVSSDMSAAVGQITSSGLGVWISLQESQVLKLHHALNFECLLEINIAPTVTKILAGCDDIIRHHKVSCLRVTALMCCKDLLWIGTSAGVLLHLPIPHVTPSSSKLSNLPIIDGFSMGHRGQCRFLMMAELVPSAMASGTGPGGAMIGGPLGGSVMPSGYLGPSGDAGVDNSKRRMSLNVAALQQGKVLVISGGDGFEDYQDVDPDEPDDSVGREDTTNYMLIWQC